MKADQKATAIQPIFVGENAKDPQIFFDATSNERLRQGIFHLKKQLAQQAVEFKIKRVPAYRSNEINLLIAPGLNLLL